MRTGRNVERFGGTLSLLASGLAACAVGLSVSSLPKFATPDALFICTANQDLAGSLPLYSQNLTWLSMVTLEAVIAGFACFFSAFCIYKAAQAGGTQGFVPFGFLFIVGASFMIWDISLVNGMKGANQTGFLSHLLSTLKDCASVSKSVIRGRMLGEPPGIFIGIAMAASVTMARAPSVLELGQRMRRLNHLLYAASVLFVAGILVTRANINLILAYWNVAAEEKATLTAACVLASGIAYSCILVIFYIPARALGGWHAENAIPEAEAGTLEAREKWLKENGLAPGFRAELQQVLAILAPVISAPVFEALAKS
jgi:hypothetical protein